MSEPAILDLMPLLRRYARSLARDRFDAEDLLQDCLVTAYSREDDWRGVNRKAWLMKIMTNLNFNRLRKNRKSRDLFEADQDGQNIAHPASPDPVEQRSLRAALELLSPENRAVLMLVSVEGYSYAEAAEILDVPVGTVMSRLSRTRKFLAGQLAGDNVFELRRPE